MSMNIAITITDSLERIVTSKQSVGSIAIRQRSKVGTLSLKKKREWISYCFKVTSSTYFHYFDETDTNKAKGQILLHQVTRVEILNPASGLGYPFAVHFEDKNSPWILSAASETDRASWVETIKPGTLAQWKTTPTPSFTRLEHESYDAMATPPSTQPTPTTKNFFMRLFSKDDDQKGPPTTLSPVDPSSQLGSPVVSMQSRRSLDAGLPRCSNTVPPRSSITIPPYSGALTSQVSIGEVWEAKPPPQASTPPGSTELLYAEPYMEPSQFTAAFVGDHSEPLEGSFWSQGAEREPLLPDCSCLEVEQVPPRKTQTPLPVKKPSTHLNISPEKKLGSVSCPDSLCCPEVPWDLGFKGQVPVKTPLTGNTQKVQMPQPDYTQKTQMSLPDYTQKAQMPLPSNTQKAQMPLPDYTQKAQMPLPSNTQKVQMPLPDYTQKAQMPLPDYTQKAQMPLASVEGANKVNLGDVALVADQIRGLPPDQLQQVLAMMGQINRAASPKAMLDQQESKELLLPEDSASMLDLTSSLSLLITDMENTFYIPSSALSDLLPIGHGQYGEVFRATLHKGTPGEVLVAVKTTKKNSSEKEKDDFAKEMAVMSTLLHPNIVRFYGVVHRAPESDLIVLEYLPAGDLKSHLMKFTPSRKQLLKYMTDVATGMHYISEKGLVHRDLAARNVLVGENEVCKVADFGLLRELPEDGDIYFSIHNIPCPIKWMAPESIEGGEFSVASDVWSFGILMWEMFNPSKPPYQGMSNMECAVEVCKGYRLPLPRGIPSIMARIMEMCWQQNPHKRPKFQLILSLLTTNALSEVS